MLYKRFKSFLVNFVKFPTVIKQMLETNHRSNKLMTTLIQISSSDYVKKHLFDNPLYNDPKKLNRYEYQSFSQGGEDGIIEEIFNRIGINNHQFVEFGVGDGLENNTAYLLMKNWSGYWIEGEKSMVDNIMKTYAPLVEKHILRVEHAFITAENIEALIGRAKLPHEFDLLSIDIDGNDYWVWKNISNYHPRVVVIEYNGLFRPPMKWVKTYNPNSLWHKNSYHGASLKSLELLGIEKGYRLVGCNFMGTNAFFVREDLVGEKFQEPYTAENHYESQKLFLITRLGFERTFGEFVAT